MLETETVQNLTNPDLKSEFEVTTSKILILFNELDNRKKNNKISKDESTEIGGIILNFVMKLFENNGMGLQDFDEGARYIKTLMLDENR